MFVENSFAGRDAHNLRLAREISTQGTCARKKVGCVLVNGRGHIIGTGRNGNASGLPHCIVNPCKGASIPAGQKTGTCEAIHAEANALLQCKDVYEIEVAYVTHSPCKQCIKLLLNTSCKFIIFSDMSEAAHQDGLDMWTDSGRTWLHLDINGERS